jgi:hypothetical protein
MPYIVRFPLEPGSSLHEVYDRDFLADLSNIVSVIWGANLSEKAPFSPAAWFPEAPGFNPGSRSLSVILTPSSGSSSSDLFSLLLRKGREGEQASQKG